jgi:uncharacterized protein YbaA (DUF1428 family)
MAKYVDGFVLPVPKNKVADYKRMASKSKQVWKDHGALDYVEAVADDVKPGKWTSFPQSVKARPDETVVFAFVTYKSRAHRDKVMKAVMADPRIAAMMKQKPPFDGKRMFFGGFKSLVTM